YKKQFVLAIFSLILAASATLAVPLSFRQIIDLGFNANSDNQINQTFLILFIVACLVALGTSLRFYMVSWLGEKITTDIRAAVYSHVIKQSPEFFESTHSGEILSRLNTDTVLIQTLIGTSVSMAIRNILLLAGGLVMMFITSPKLSVLIFATLLLTIIPTMIMGRRVRKLSRASQDKIADASALAGEKLNAIPTIQSFTNEKVEINRFNQSIQTALDAAITRTRARSLLTFVAILFGFTSIILVLWLGVYAVIVAGAIAGISEVIGDTQRAIGASDRLLELLNVQSTIQDFTIVKSIPKVNAAGIGVQIQNLSFRYPSNPNSVLSNISLEIKPGERVAIVGPSGAGKTTLFQLLQRFYDPTSGTILFSDINIQNIPLEALRKMIGVVPQDIVIFSDNAMENIRFGKMDATDEEVLSAARLAIADEFISKLPDGYQSFLGDRGIRLSGGQKQRIAIARVLLKNPALLLLDEATSALDAESELLVQRALEAAMDSRTTLVIAHRLSTVKQADKILVLENGKIIETGTHADLIQRSGLYSRLAKLQFTDQ
ncbi:MAG: ATP-binding cassette domain-containing protein, partial [Burkholderiaceae bacterium]|nr:ATP-binding cassette domain-containing protein [Burkholderiaceae bacterium]